MCPDGLCWRVWSEPELVGHVQKAVEEGKVGSIVSGQGHAWQLMRAHACLEQLLAAHPSLAVRVSAACSLASDGPLAGRLLHPCLRAPMHQSRENILAQSEYCKSVP